MKYILGSGVNGLAAKKLLGSDWTVIPFTKSRFYCFQPPLADNYIIRDQKIDSFVEHLGGRISTAFYKTSYSYQGGLYPFNDSVFEAWAQKTFGDVPGQCQPYMSKRTVNTVYDLRVSDLYNQLQKEYYGQLIAESKKGKLIKIDKEFIYRENEKLPYTHIVSTIPLDVLGNLFNAKYELPARRLWYYCVASRTLDFEGANQLLVADPSIPFFKSVNIASGLYLFYSTSDIPRPGAYFQQFASDIDIIDGTSIDRALPIGDRPDLADIEKLNIFCVGAFAQWDWCMDIGSCLIRLLQIEPKVR